MCHAHVWRSEDSRHVCAMHTRLEVRGQHVRSGNTVVIWGPRVPVMCSCYLGLESPALTSMCRVSPGNAGECCRWGTPTPSIPPRPHLLPSSWCLSTHCSQKAKFRAQTCAFCSPDSPGVLTLDHQVPFQTMADLIYRELAEPTMLLPHTAFRENQNLSWMCNNSAGDMPAPRVSSYIWKRDLKWLLRVCIYLYTCICLCVWTGHETRKGSQEKRKNSGGRWEVQGVMGYVSSERRRGTNLGEEGNELEGSEGGEPRTV